MAPTSVRWNTCFTPYTWLIWQEPSPNDATISKVLASKQLLWKTVKESVKELFTSPLEDCQREFARIIHFASGRLSKRVCRNTLLRLWKTVIYFASGRLSKRVCRNRSLRLWKSVKDSVPEYFTSPLEDCHSLRLWKTVKESVPESFTSPLEDCHSLRPWKTVKESVPEPFTSPLEDYHSLRLWKTVKESVPELFTSPLQEDPGYLTVVVPASSVRCGDLGPLPEADETAWTILTVLRELHPWQESDSKHWQSFLQPLP